MQRECRMGCILHTFGPAFYIRPCVLLGRHWSNSEACIVLFAPGIVWLTPVPVQIGRFQVSHLFQPHSRRSSRHLCPPPPSSDRGRSSRHRSRFHQFLSYLLLSFLLFAVWRCRERRSEGEETEPKLWLWELCELNSLKISIYFQIFQKYCIVIILVDHLIYTPSFAIFSVERLPVVGSNSQIPGYPLSELQSVSNHLSISFQEEIRAQCSLPPTLFGWSSCQFR